MTEDIGQSTRADGTFGIKIVVHQFIDGWLDVGIRRHLSLPNTFTILGDYALNYRVMGVPGVTTTPPTGPVPEPASWALMIAGFAAVGSMMRRQQARFAIASA